MPPCLAWGWISGRTGLQFLVAPHWDGISPVISVAEVCSNPKFSCETTPLPVQLLTINTGRFGGGQKQRVLPRGSRTAEPLVPCHAHGCSSPSQLPAHRSMKNGVQQLFSEIPRGIRTRRAGQRCGWVWRTWLCPGSPVPAGPASPAGRSVLTPRSPRPGTVSCCWLGGMTASTNTATPLS